MSPDGPAGDPGKAVVSCPRYVSISIEPIQVVDHYDPGPAQKYKEQDSQTHLGWRGCGVCVLRGYSDSGGLSPRFPLYTPPPPPTLFHDFWPICPIYIFLTS